MKSDSLLNLTLKPNTFVVEVYSPIEVYSPKLQRCVPLKSGTLQDNRMQRGKKFGDGDYTFLEILFSMLPIALSWLKLVYMSCRLVNGRAIECQ